MGKTQKAARGGALKSIVIYEVVVGRGGKRHATKRFRSLMEAGTWGLAELLRAEGTNPSPTPAPGAPTEYSVNSLEYEYPEDAPPSWLHV